MKHTVDSTIRAELATSARGRSASGKHWAMRAHRAAWALAAALTLTAGKAGAAAPPVNHIYISHHSNPNYAVTIRNYAGKVLLKEFKKTCTGGCKLTFDYGIDGFKGYPASMQRADVSITVGFLQPFRISFPYSNVSYDHCILVKAMGKVYSTGDNRTGCHRP